jgi:hypothetical protein
MTSSASSPGGLPPDDWEEEEEVLLPIYIPDDETASHWRSALCSGQGVLSVRNLESGQPTFELRGKESVGEEDKGRQPETQTWAATVREVLGTQLFLGREDRESELSPMGLARREVILQMVPKTR